MVHPTILAYIRIMNAIFGLFRESYFYILYVRETASAAQCRTSYHPPKGSILIRHYMFRFLSVFYHFIVSFRARRCDQGPSAIVSTETPKQRCLASSIHQAVNHIIHLWMLPIKACANLNIIPVHFAIKVSFQFLIFKPRFPFCQTQNS